MAWFNKASDADLRQSMALASECAKRAREHGDREREEAFHEDLNGMITEAENRGWSKGRNRD
ncbi:hypothetical protein [Streptomyces sp. NPDC049906]|uniref:hypothetical protein n=1 Tax=Streptomyces sp. NPDC049906 TaxID=3155656 RepID=UPI00341A0242